MAHRIERCWKIVEHLPIRVEVRNILCQRAITVPPLTMTHGTWQHLGQNHRHQDIRVRGISYDYLNGECEFRASSQRDLDLWLEKYADYVTVNKPITPDLILV